MAAVHLAMVRNAVSPITVPVNMISLIKVLLIAVSVMKVSVIKVSVDPGPVYRAWMGRPHHGRRKKVPHTVRAASACWGTCIACT